MKYVSMNPSISIVPLVLHEFVATMNVFFKEIDFMANGTKDAHCHGRFQKKLQPT
jgi:hypothetical protein